MHPDYSKQKGVTIVELLIAITLIAILATSSTLLLDPAEKRARARDNRRLSDISTLDRAVNEYLIDYGDYPDLFMVLRDSTTLPGGGISVDNSSAGWIDADLSSYTSHLPIDPVNDAAYRYYYYREVTSYELNAVMEILTDEAANDGGDDPARYEIGNDLTLISP